MVGSPAPVAAPTLTSLSGGQVRVAWTAPATNGSALTGYSIWHKQGTGDWTEVTGIGASATSHTLTLTAGQTYSPSAWRRIHARGGSNPSATEFGGATTSTAATITLAASAVTETTATLTIANHTGNWYHKYTVPTTPAGTCSSAVSAATASLTGLTGGTAYTWKAYSDSGCTTEIASETFSTVGLTAGSLTQTTATLTLSNWTADWWHKKTVPATPAGTCVSVAANTLTASLASLAAGTAHTWEVYSATGCNAADKIADVSFTTAATITLAASAVTETTATLTIANHTGDWYHKRTVTTTPAGTCSSAVSAATASLTGLTGGTAYTWKAYSDSGCTTEIASETFSTVGLSAGSLTQTTATLTLSNWTADWWHKKTVPATPAGTCVSVAANTLTASLASLAAGTAHTWEVYSATGCNAADKIADVSFTTAATITLAASAVTETTATLTIANHTGDWYHKRTDDHGRHLLVGGERRDGKPDRSDRRHGLHLEGVQRQRLHDRDSQRDLLDGGLDGGFADADHGDADPRQLDGGLVAQEDRAGDTRRDLRFRGRQYADGEPDEPGGGHRPHLGGVQRHGLQRRRQDRRRGASPPPRQSHWRRAR